MMSLPEKEARKIVALMYWGRDNGHPDIQVVHNQFDSQHTEILVMMACDKLPLADYLIAAVRLAEASGLDIEGDFDSEVEGGEK